MSKKPSIDPIYARLIDDQPIKTRTTERIQTNVSNENTEILIDSDNEDELTSSGVSEDEDFEEEETEEHQCQEGNILQPTKLCPHRINVNAQKMNVTITQAENMIESTHINNDQLLAQTMALLTAKYRHTKPKDSKLTKTDILSFVGPCPLYSLPCSFGLDMHHGLSYFPCRDVLADGGGHQPAPPLWQHLTSHHNLNLSSSSLIISHLILHGYSTSTPILFSSNNTTNILRTTPRYPLVKKCPLTRYGIYGIEFEHGTRLCSGLTYNMNIYSHLISFHKMTHDASLRLSRAVAFHDKQFRFQSNEILVSELIKYPPLKICRIKANHQFQTKQCHLSKETLSNQQPVTIPSN